MTPAAALLTVIAAATAATAQTPDPTRYAAATEIRAQITRMERGMKVGQGFAWEPLVGADGQVAGLEIWRSPGPPAVHPDEAEYVTVMDGAGTMLSGGVLIDPRATQPGLTEGTRITGGTLRTLKPGDVFLIPAGVPHGFGVTGGQLVLLGTKIRSATPHHP